MSHAAHVGGRKKNRMDVISSRGIEFFEIYIYIYNIIGRLGNRNERSEWKHVRGRVGSTIINSLLSSLFRTNVC